MKRRMKQYSAYRGDEYIMTGNKFELAERLGVQPETIRWYATPSYRRRIEKIRRVIDELL